MFAKQVTLAAAAAQLPQHYIDGLVIQAPSTNSQNAYVGNADTQIYIMAPNTTLTLPNTPESSLIWVRGTAGDKLNIIGM